MKLTRKSILKSLFILLIGKNVMANPSNDKRFTYQRIIQNYYLHDKVHRETLRKYPPSTEATRDKSKHFNKAFKEYKKERSFIDLKTDKTIEFKDEKRHIDSGLFVALCQSVKVALEDHKGHIKKDIRLFSNFLNKIRNEASVKNIKMSTLFDLFANRALENHRILFGEEKTAAFRNKLEILKSLLVEASELTQEVFPKSKQDATAITLRNKLFTGSDFFENQKTPDTPDTPDESHIAAIKDAHENFLRNIVAMTLDFYNESLNIFGERIYNPEYSTNFQFVSRCMQAIGYIYGPLITTYRLLDSTGIPYDDSFDYIHILFIDILSPSRLEVKDDTITQDEIINSLISETHKKGNEKAPKGNSLYLYFKIAIKQILEINYKNNYTGLPGIVEQYDVKSILQLYYLIQGKKFSNLRKILDLDHAGFKKKLNGIVEESKKGASVSSTDFTSEDIETHKELVNYSIQCLKADPKNIKIKKYNEIREAVLNALLDQENNNSPLTILYKNCLYYFERILFITLPNQENTAKGVSDKIKNELDMMISNANNHMGVYQIPVETAQEECLILQKEYEMSLIELVRLFCVEYIRVKKTIKEKEVNPVAIVFLSNLKAIERILNTVVAPIPVNVNESDLTFSIVNFVLNNFSHQNKNNKDEFYREMSEKLKNEREFRLVSFRNNTVDPHKIENEAFCLVEDTISPFSTTPEFVKNQIASLNPQPVQDSNEAAKPNTDTSSSKESESG